MCRFIFIPSVCAFVAKHLIQSNVELWSCHGLLPKCITFSAVVRALIKYIKMYI